MLRGGPRGKVPGKCMQGERQQRWWRYVHQSFTATQVNSRHSFPSTQRGPGGWFPCLPSPLSVAALSASLGERQSRFNCHYIHLFTPFLACRLSPNRLPPFGSGIPPRGPQLAACPPTRCPSRSWPSRPATRSCCRSRGTGTSLCFRRRGTGKVRNDNRGKA